MAALFSVQDDDGAVADANAYIDLDYFRQYHEDRGRDTSGTTDDEATAGIVRATDYVDMRWRERFAGQMLEHDDEDFVQTTEFPRQNAYRNRGGKAITGIPIELKKAVAEYSLRAAETELLVDGPTPIVDGEQQPTGEVTMTSVTVGPITDTKQFASSDGGFALNTLTTDGCLLPKIPAADLMIEVLLDQQGRQRRAVRS